jgi:hypothetical protein
MTANESLTLTVAVLAFLAAAGSAHYARKALDRADTANKIAESSVRFQVLWPTLTDYMSTEMYVAVGHLWTFYKEDPSTLKERDRVPSRGVTPQPGRAEMHAVLSAAQPAGERGQYR